MAGIHDQAPPVGTTLAGGYQLMRFLGAGGMSCVYEARRDDGLEFALKVQLGVRRNGPEITGRFAREGRIAMELDHPNLVPVLDSGHDDDLNIPYLVMPLLSGLDLAALISRIGPLHPTVAARLIHQVCAGLTAAHEAGVVHRDIKPGNIYLDHEANGEITARVLDFGVAKQVHNNEELTRSGSMIGTPVYMAPEHIIDAKNVTPRADIWSLGLTLYNAFTAYVPFSHLDSYTAILLAVHQEDIPHVQDSAPWLDPALAKVAHGTLLRIVEKRCPDAQALADALEPFIGGTNTVRAEELVAVDAHLRRTEAPRAVLGESWEPEKPENALPELIVNELDNLLNEKVGGRYTIKRLIGDGGMGAVYEAHSDEGERVALKVIKDGPLGMGRRARIRFVREARMLIDIEHENVVRVIDADTDSEREQPFIVMELLQGCDLQSYINEHGALEQGPVARLFATACRALGKAHELGIVHRDLKPANLFLHEHVNGELTVKVCDFGVAKRIGMSDSDTTAVTHTGGVVGSPVYMSPEQTKDAGSIDARSDIWSMGIALYQALSGNTPWAAYGTVGQLIVAICTEELPHLQDQAPWVRQGLAKVVHTALARKPEMRFESAEAFADALDEFADDLLKRERLLAVRNRERVKVAPRAAPPDSITMDHASVMSHSVDEIPEAPPAKGKLVVAGAAMLCLGAAGAYALFGGPPEAPPPPTRASTSAAPPQAAKIFRVKVPVEPANATVTVDGTKTTLRDGQLEIKGEPGDSFHVVAMLGDRRLDTKLVLSKNGRVAPSRVVLPSPKAAPSALPSAHAIRPVRLVKPVPPQEPKKVAAPPTLSATAPPAPPPPKSPGELLPKDAW